jgi:hypothetical protein
MIGPHQDQLVSFCDEDSTVAGITVKESFNADIGAGGGKRVHVAARN